MRLSIVAGGLLGGLIVACAGSALADGQGANDYADDATGLCRPGRDDVNLAMGNLLDLVADQKAGYRQGSE